MDEITMFASIRPQAPDDADLNEMRMGARRRVTAAGAPRAPWRRPLLGAGLTAAVAGGAAAAVVLTSGGTPAPTAHLSNVVTAAWSVRENSNGTVTIAVREFTDPARLQQVLRADGVNAYVRQPGIAGRVDGNNLEMYAICRYADTNQAPRAVQRAVVALRPRSLSGVNGRGWIIHPSAMPAGSALFLAGGPVMDGTRPFGLAITEPVVLNNDKLPACVPVTPPPPSP